MKKIAKLWIVGLFIFLLGVSLLLRFNPYPDIQVEAVKIPVNAQQTLISRLYLPRNPSFPLPVVILCHGVNNSKEMMTPLAIEFARNGIAAIPFDFGGYGESYSLKGALKSIDSLGESTQQDAKAILNFILQESTRFDEKKIGIIGHSLGGVTALDLAKKEPIFKTTGVLSISGDATPTKPKNLFLGVGIYEQLNPAYKIRTTLQEAVKDEPKNCIYPQSCGNFKQETARQLLVSPTSDHVTAPYNPIFIQNLLHWLQSSFVIPVSQKTLIVPGFIVGSILTFWGLIIINITLGLQFFKNRQRSFSLVIVGLILISFGLGKLEIINPSLASLLILFLLPLLLLGNYALRSPHSFIPKLTVALLYITLAFIAFAVPTILGGINEIFAQPRYLLLLPKFLVQWAFFILYNYAQVTKIAFFPSYTSDLTLSWLGWLLIAVELIFPGMVLGGIAQLFIWLLDWLRSPFRLGMSKISHQEMMILIVLLLVLAIVLYQRATDELLFVAFDMGIIVLKLFSLLVLMPLLIFILGIRSRFFRHLESLFFDKLKRKPTTP